MSSESPANKLKKVCFICGSYTTLTINIYEPRSDSYNGPNIVDVINQKFRVQPLNEDKFLCYSCNNWLINWHSLQNKNEPSSSNAGKTTSRVNQSIPEEHHQETMAVLVDQYSDVLQIRSRLQKYFYPKKQAPKITKSAIHRLISKCNLCGHRTRKGHLYLYARKSVVDKRCLRFCQKCKQRIREYFNVSTTLCDSSSQRIFKQCSSQLVNPYVVSRLKKLGTTVMCEGKITTLNASASADNDLSHTSPANITHHLNHTEKIDESVIQSGPNEIVISFNKVLQEVFPVDLCLKNCKDVVGMKVDEISDFSNIYKRIPKSLTITLV